LSVDIKIYAYATCFTDLIVAFNSQKLILHIPDTINWDYLYHNWLTLSTEFKAKGNEKYLIIGEGNSSDYVQIIRSDSIKNLNKYDLKLSYLIDNVFLIPTIKENMDVLTNKTDSSKIGESFTLHDILFDFNKFGLCCESITTLNPLVCYLKTNLNVELLIIGHTDNEGSDLYNKNLSYNRAKSVVDYLITKGVSASRLKYRGEGANKPISTNVSEEGRKKNRRVEIQLINK